MIPHAASSDARCGNEPERMKRSRPLVQRPVLAAAALLAAFTVHAQQTFYWTGGAGRWNDAAHWSVTPGGTGGAGVPGAKDAVTIDARGAVTLSITADAACRDLRIDASSGTLTLQGEAGSALTI